MNNIENENLNGTINITADMTDKNKIKCPHCDKEIDVEIFKKHLTEIQKKEILSAEEKGFDKGKDAARKEKYDVLEKNIGNKYENKFQVKLEEKDQDILHKNKEIEGDKLQIKRLNDSILELKKKTEQGSVEAQGTVQENIIKNFLEKKFPQDIITPYKKGARGPDCLQTIREDAISLGNIMIESKDTKKWDKFWVEKLSKDMQKKNAQIGVIVSVTLPNGVDGCQYFHNNRIIVCPMNFNILDAIIMSMRTMIVNIYKTNKLNKGSSNKATKLWEYCRSPSFQIAIERFVQEFIKEQEQLDKDDRTFQLSKKERQKRIDSKKEIFNEFVSGIKSLSDSDDPKKIK